MKLPLERPAISRYPVPKLEQLPEDIRARILEVQEKAGFIPNVFLTLAHRPDEFHSSSRESAQRIPLDRLAHHVAAPDDVDGIKGEGIAGVMAAEVKLFHSAASAIRQSVT